MLLVVLLSRHQIEPSSSVCAHMHACVSVCLLVYVCTCVREMEVLGGESVGGG